MTTSSATQTTSCHIFPLIKQDGNMQFEVGHCLRSSLESDLNSRQMSLCLVCVYITL